MKTLLILFLMLLSFTASANQCSRKWGPDPKQVGGTIVEKDRALFIPLYHLRVENCVINNCDNGTLLCRTRWMRVSRSEWRSMSIGDTVQGR